jgi:hypothetical protein
VEQPQNWLPGSEPSLAVRSTIELPHFGHDLNRVIGSRAGRSHRICLWAAVKIGLKSIFKASPPVYQELEGIHVQQFSVMVGW